MRILVVDSDSANFDDSEIWSTSEDGVVCVEACSGEMSYASGYCPVASRVRLLSVLKWALAGLSVSNSRSVGVTVESCSNLLVT